MKIRLLQARDADDPVREEEARAFADRLRIPRDDVLTWDATRQPLSLDAVATGVDAVMVGGSGAYGVGSDVPWMAPFVELMAELAHRQVPTFASCFGFQAMVVALGGTVKPDERRAEVGTYDIHLTPEGQADPVFGHLPRRFRAQLGHKDRAWDWPDDVIALAWSNRCPYQALRIPGAPVWATQFHPELTGTENLSRLERYEAHYRQLFGDRYEALVMRFGESPETEGILRAFVEEVGLGRGGARTRATPPPPPPRRVSSPRRGRVGVASVGPTSRSASPLLLAPARAGATIPFVYIHTDRPGIAFAALRPDAVVQRSWSAKGRTLRPLAHTPFFVAMLLARDARQTPRCACVPCDDGVDEPGRDARRPAPDSQYSPRLPPARRSRKRLAAARPPTPRLSPARRSRKRLGASPPPYAPPLASAAKPQEVGRSPPPNAPPLASAAKPQEVGRSPPPYAPPLASAAKPQEVGRKPAPQRPASRQRGEAARGWAQAQP